MGKIRARELHSAGSILFGTLHPFQVVGPEWFAASDNFIGNRLQRFIDIGHGWPSSGVVVTTNVLIVQRSMLNLHSACVRTAA